MKPLGNIRSGGLQYHQVSSCIRNLKTEFLRRLNEAEFGQLNSCCWHAIPNFPPKGHKTTVFECYLINGERKDPAIDCFSRPIDAIDLQMYLLEMALFLIQKTYLVYGIKPFAKKSVVKCFIIPFIGPTFSDNPTDWMKNERSANKTTNQLSEGIQEPNERHIFNKEPPWVGWAVAHRASALACNHLGCETCWSDWNVTMIYEIFMY